MPSQSFLGGLTTLLLMMGCRLGIAVDVAQDTGQMPFTGPSSTSSANVTPSMMALPVENGTAENKNGGATGNGPSVPGSPDANASRKFYTITAELRETYDDNVNTTKTNKVSSLETSINPSILVDFPTTDSDFSARYTFGATYYGDNSGGQGSSQNTTTGRNLDLTHEFVAQVQHSFSPRFTVNASEQFRYFTEPSVFSSTGTFFRSGPYISNLLNGVFNAQWTPLLSTTTTYANTVVDYQNADEAMQQNNIENTGSESVNFAILPKLVLSLGAIADNSDYQQTVRGYTSYTGYVGGQWQALPYLSLILRGGGSYTYGQSQPASLTPYIDAELNWGLGKRSQLAFVYSHEVVPTDQFGADGEIADRFSASFSYNVTPNISTHLQAIYTYAQVTPTLLITGLIPAYVESDYGLDTGATYHYNNYVDFEGGIQIFGVSSGLSARDYNRNEVYLGVRGTY